MDYLAGARAKFEDANNALKLGKQTPELMDDAKVAAHKLAGNALMYGFPELGDKAREFETFLNKNPNFDPGLCRSRLLKLITDIDKIRNQPLEADTHQFESDNFQPDQTPDRWETDSMKTEGYGLPSRQSSVLLIHKDPWMIQMITNMLAPEYRVTGCQQAHQAMAIAVNQPPDIVIMEQDLEDMTGVDVARFMRAVEQLQATPIVMIMSGQDPHDIVKAVDAGVSDCFENAFEILPLVAHVREILRKQQFHVLIVDDDRAVSDLLAHRFKTYGARADKVYDGIEALEYLRTQKPDLIILDRMMPRLEGGAVLYQIQQEINLKSIPVMLVTAMANRDDVITWLKRGAIDYITKPFNPDEVVLRALRHLRIEQNAA